MAARPGFERGSDKEEEEHGSDDASEQEGWESNEEEFNPYNCHFDVAVGAHVSHEDLKISFAHLPQVPEMTKLGMRLETLMVDKDVVARRLVHLQKQGIFLYKVDLTPHKMHSRTGSIENWAKNCKLTSQLA